VHPDFPDRGTRTLPVSPTVFVSSVDYYAFTRQEIRLKDFCNVVLDATSTFTSREVKDVPKIQWVSEGIPMRIVMPNGVVAEGLAEANLAAAKAGNVVQLERFGFVRIDAADDDGLLAYFAHR
jgi:glutamyl-tRNA synthetase